MLTPKEIHCKAGLLDGSGESICWRIDERKKSLNGVDANRPVFLLL